MLDPLNQALLDHLAAENGPPVYSLTPEQARTALVQLQSAPVPRPDAEIEDRTIETGPHQLRLRSFRARQATSPCPGIIYFHGGGWVVGDATTHDRLVRELAVGAGATVIVVDYDRAPEHHHPVAIEQGYAAVRHVSEHPEEFGVDATRLAVAGDSAGGNLATVVALLSRRRSGPAIALQLLFYPVTSADEETASYRAFADGPWLTRRAMQWFWDQYLPERGRRQDPTASPLLATSDQLAGSPRTLIITAENDILRDQGEAYGRKLIEAGVEVVTTRFNSTIHDFMMLNALAAAAPTRAAITEAVGFIKDGWSRKAP
jgi:acetyl esterase